MFDAVKSALRVSHSALDNEIEDIIEAARLDLKLSGVSSVKADSDEDALIKRAIITYAKANFISDVNMAEKYQKSYDSLKIHLTLAGDYTQ